MPPAVLAAIPAIAAVAGAGASIYGAATAGEGGGGDAATQAASIQAASADRAAQLQYQMYQDAVARMQPWFKAGGAAVGQLGGLYNLPGYDKIDPTETLQATPGYNWLQGQGVQALDRSAAGRGMLMSGPQQKGLTSFGQNLALTNAWNPYISGLQNLSGSGQQAAGTSGQFGVQTVQQMGQDYLMAGQAQAQGLYNQYLANQMGGTNWSELGGMGMGLGMSGLKGLGGLFGGGGAPSYIGGETGAYGYTGTPFQW